MSYWFLDGGGGWRFIIPLIKPGDTVIGSNQSINKFFSKIPNVSVISLRTPTTLFKRSIISVIPNVIRSKLEYCKHFKHLNDEDIYLFGQIATITFFSYLNKLSTNNRVHFLVPSTKIDPDKWLYTHKKYKSLYTIPMKVIGHLMNVDIGITETLGRPMWFMKRGTVKKYNYIEYDPVDSPLTIEYKKYCDGKDTLLLLNDLNTLVYNPLETSNIVASLLDKSRTVVKNHTREPKIFGDINKFDTIPPYIPVEMIINAHPWKYIVSIYISKTMLVNTTAKKISLYNMFKWKMPVTRNWIMTCKDEEFNVHMPNSKKELMEIIK